MADKHEVSLASVVAGYSAAAIALGMGIYAIYQHYAMPDKTVLELILEHSLHVIVLGLLIYGMLYAVLYGKVVKPIRDLYLKLYAITRGNLSSINVNSNIIEIAQIAEGVQILLDGMDQSIPKVSLTELSNRTQKIRSIAKKPDALDPPAKDFLMNVANEIDDVVKELSLTKHSEQ
jgi:hypothetical protein